MSAPLSRAAGLDLRFRVRPSLAAQIDRARIGRLCRAILDGEGIGEPCSLTVSLMGEDEIAALNSRHRGIDRPTDVLSFPLDVPRTGAAGADENLADFVRPPGQPRELGDVVVSYPRAVNQAAEYGHSLERELGYLVAHGLLHILGYDHETEAERSVMRAREEAALTAVGLTR